MSTKKKIVRPAADVGEEKPNQETGLEAGGVLAEGETPPATIDDELITEAIEEGAALLALGKPKIEAALAIYQKLEDKPQEVVVDAFIKGANLTPKGALTYWYNCRRKLRKQRALIG